MVVSINSWMVYRENPSKLDDDWGSPHDYGNPHICCKKIPRLPKQSSPCESGKLGGHGRSARWIHPGALVENHPIPLLNSMGMWK